MCTSRGTIPQTDGLISVESVLDENSFKRGERPSGFDKRGERSRELQTPNPL